MRRHISAIFLIISFLATPALAQFKVISSTPANATTNVKAGDMVSISFTFNQALDTSQKYGQMALPIDFLDITPADSISILNYMVSSDHKTITLQVSQKANTDYVWIVINARSQNGQLLDSPYILNYTTSATYGTGVVSGKVTLKSLPPQGAFVALTTQKPNFGSGTLNSFYGGGTGSPVFGPQKLNPYSTASTTTSSVPIAAIVSNTDGTYSMNTVRDSVYYPIAVADLNFDGEINPMSGDAIGFYDPNADGVPDSIVVKGGTHFNIDIKMINYDPVTADTYLTTATDIAATYANDQVLYYMLSMNQKVTSDGKSPFWAYVYHSQKKNLNTVVIGTPMDFAADTTLSFLDTNFGNTTTSLKQVNLDLYKTQESTSSFISSFKYPIPNGSITSDQAMAIAEANGGSDFRSSHVLYNVLVAAGQSNKAFTTDTTETVWTIVYQSFDGNSPIYGDKKLYFLINMTDGKILKEERVAVSTTPIEKEPQQQQLPGQIELLQNYPNPFNPTTHIDFILPQASKLTLRVYNLLGQEVKELANGRFSPGRHSIVLDASNLSSGIYFYRLQLENNVITKKLTLLK